MHQRGQQKEHDYVTVWLLPRSSCHGARCHRALPCTFSLVV